MHDKPPPTVSVVTAFYNRGSSALESLKSLLDQRDVDFEIVAVDDGSTDDTLTVLRSIKDPRLTVIAQANGGFTRAINTAVAHAAGRYIAVHGSGDISLPLRLARQAAVLDRQAHVGIVGCYVRDQAKLNVADHVARFPNGLPFFETLLYRNLFTHGEVMFRKALFDKVGGYREIFTYAQDRDLWLRISQHATYEIVPEVLYERRVFDNSVSRDADKLIMQAYAADFAAQVAMNADEQGDWITRHGALAIFLRRPSANLARRIAWTGARLMVSGEVTSGWRLIRQACREKLTRQVAMIWLLVLPHKVWPLWQVTRPMLVRRLARIDA